MRRSLEFVVSEEEAGERLDRMVIARAGERLGRKRTAELFRSGAIRVSGRRAKKGEVARAGDRVRVELDTGEAVVAERDAPLDVRLETPDFVVVSKPAGLPAAPLRPGERPTLAGALLARYPEMRGVGHREREPGLLHRLDTQTSGLLVAARHPKAFERGTAALRAGALEKRYLAIVETTSLPASGRIDRPLAPHPSDPRRVVVLDAPPARARIRETRWRRVQVAGRWALLEVTAKRAYRHQVRVHLASIGHPIAGDALYGGASVPALGERHALHASYVAWTGDGVVGGFAVDAPLPEDLTWWLAG